ncbi:TNF receptor-associated factor 2-like isoform X2 [Acropora palmata]|uniref:TNF receptor-associated factor 2-like isoform X2 n=1 Tax=Acropora palmata TaxID=6131 RepID=UPI003DA1BD2A
MPGFRVSSTAKVAIDKKYLCPLCQLIFKDPVQTDCGHVYCNPCLQELKRHDEGFTCPVDMQSFDTLFPDNFMKREVLSLIIDCPNSDDDCKWKGEVRHSEVHLASCPAEKEQCTNNNCPTKVKRSEFQRHVQHECLYRQQLCPLCNQSMTAAVLKVHLAQECKMTKVQCDRCGREGILRGEKMKPSEAKKHYHLTSVPHLNLLLSFVLRLEKQVMSLINPVTGAFGASFSDELVRSSEELISTAIARIDSVVAETRDLTRMLGDHDRRIKMLERKVTSKNGMLTSTSMHPDSASNNMELLIKDETKCEQYNLKQEVSLIRRQLEEAIGSIQQLQRQMDLSRQNLGDANGVPSGTEQQISSYDGTLLWKVTDFARKRNDAVSGRQVSIYSPCFYTSLYGYKMRARLYLNGDGMGRGTHVSVFFALMRGEYDATLRWPFRQKVTIMLLDQDHVEHVIDAFRPDPSSSSFQRPRRESNIASGCPLFCSLTMLNNHAYIREDTMFLRIIVDTSDI